MLTYGQYRSTVDWPGARFWRELADHYPSARVILTVRDPEKWYDSARSTLFQAISNRPARMSAEAMRVITMMNLVVWDGVFKGRFADKDHALQVFAEHNAAVQREISADRLLVFDVAQGWGPLCDFLGVPVPGEQFPRLNNREAYAAKHRERVVAAMSASGVQP
ncbi:sulfotransferase family protein [Frankia casuarinae]|uniref:sulfotransferase family protein n=1 Tax=Frankia casuarinae (strain DSM 45818 / CECT 9043 / HFP020203 / CcI3) TaxID=106370 RepID=UPI00142F1F70|nr:sulfotransferase family protein [Frankia casuarinae]